MLRARGARGRRDSLLQYVDAPHQSDPRSDSKKRAEDRKTKRRAMEKRANKRQKGGLQTELGRAPTRRRTNKLRNSQPGESVTRKKIEARLERARKCFQEFLCPPKFANDFE